MNRDEAVAIYKEIINVCENMGSNAFNLMLSEKNDATAKGYQIRITMSTDTEIKQQITNIAKKHNLAVKEEKDEVIIYKPKKA
ncbi:MAG: hypothetical protein ABR909_12775 [Candidatus Bathyarchaeia archaeon]|jgi:broad-specificity NMP kinase